MNLLELLNQADIIPATGYYTFKLGETEVKIPKYGDISGEEAERLDMIERENAEWQSQFYSLLERIAVSKGIDQPFKLMQTLEQLEQESVEAKANYLGESFGELIKLQGQRQSNLDQTKAIALLALKRVDRNITTDHLIKLPQKVLIDLTDLIMDEQRLGTYDSRPLLEAKYEAAKAESEWLREIVNKVSEVLEPLVLGKVKSINAATVDPIFDVFAKYGFAAVDRKKPSTIKTELELERESRQNP